MLSGYRPGNASARYVEAFELRTVCTVLGLRPAIVDGHPAANMLYRSSSVCTGKTEKTCYD